MVLTIRPRGFLEIRGGELSTLSNRTIERLLIGYDAGEFAYLPYNLLPVDGEVPYGEAAIPLQYIQKSWSDRLVIIEETPSFLSDPYQRPMVMRRRN
jgi:hypothetical protein